MGMISARFVKAPLMISDKGKRESVFSRINAEKIQMSYPNGKTGGIRVYSFLFVRDFPTG